MRRLSKLLNSLGVMIEPMAFGLICYAGFRDGPRAGDVNMAFTIWMPFAVGCLLASHDVRNFK